MEIIATSLYSLIRRVIVSDAFSKNLHTVLRIFYAMASFFSGSSFLTKASAAFHHEDFGRNHFDHFYRRMNRCSWLRAFNLRIFFLSTKAENSTASD
jgi:hypothetical protein